MRAEIRAWSESLCAVSDRLQHAHDGVESERIIADLGVLVEQGEAMVRRRPDKPELREAVLNVKMAHAVLRAARRKVLN